MKYTYSLLIILVFIFTACSQEGCDQETDVMIQAGFYATGEGEPLSIDSLSVWGLNMPDSLILSMAVSDKVSLPLNPSAVASSFIIQNGQYTDTVEISYEPGLKFLSRPCGYIYVYELKEVFFTTNDINNILIINKQVNTANEENIQIFF